MPSVMHKKVFFILCFPLFVLPSQEINMNMIRFECDYTEGAHPDIMEALVKTNMEQTRGYGIDSHCEHARQLILKACGNANAKVHFLVGGTQTNMTVIDAVLRSHQGVISAATGHINVHETGAVESTGHKILTIDSADGKLTATAVAEMCKAHFDDEEPEHAVQPGMVYISNPTENGLIYTKTELSALSSVCHRYDLPLFMDGARLGYGLMSEDNDLSLADIASLCDVFYIGGTKVGALFGEAVVFTNTEIEKDFRYKIKLHGGMLAKGRLLGIQFETLFADTLYFDIAKKADVQAMTIRKALTDKGYAMWNDSKTNQQFVLMDDEQLKKMEENFVVARWGKNPEGMNIVRICTSWATTDENVEQLISYING
jgi:threonine aldolase